MQFLQIAQVNFIQHAFQLTAKTIEKTAETKSIPQRTISSTRKGRSLSRRQSVLFPESCTVSSFKRSSAADSFCFSENILQDGSRNKIALLKYSLFVHLISIICLLTPFITVSTPFPIHVYTSKSV